MQVVSRTEALGFQAELSVDCGAEADRVAGFLSETVRRLRRRGLVLGVSGGIDSAVCLALAVRALGKERVLALLMPEKESSPEATERARRLCADLGVNYLVEDITTSLEAIGCYRRRDEAVARIFPGYADGWRHKVAINALWDDRIPHFDLVVEAPGGKSFSKRMPAEIYLQIIAATNFKQRTRKTLEYFHADRLNYAVLGTPNRLEYELGFFVRGGDGLADVKPIAHLFKTQVYALARHLGVREEIQAQPPSTDTYSMPQTQEEFYFGVPFDLADQLLWAMNTGVSPDVTAARLAVSPSWVERVFADFRGKKQVADRGSRQAYLLDYDDEDCEPVAR